MDFDGLSDDQLVALIRAACSEAVRRGEVVKTAAESAILSESEKAEVAREATKRETEHLRREEAARVAAAAAQSVRSTSEEAGRKAEREKQQVWWGKKKGLAQLTTTLLGDGWTINVWERDNEQRVYLDGPAEKSAVFYATGNNSHPPGTLHCSKLQKDLRPYILEITKRAASEWRGVKINCDEAIQYSGSTKIAVPEDWTRMGQKRRERDVVEDLEATASRFVAKLNALIDKAKEAANEVVDTERGRLQGRYMSSYYERTLSESRTRMSDYAQQADELKPKLQQAQFAADIARASFEKRFPSEKKTKSKQKEDTNRQ